MQQATVVREQGFTLLELLVVIAILGILATVVFVSTAPSRQEARNTQTVSQVEEFKKAIDLYYIEEGSVPAPFQDQLSTVPRNFCLVTCFGDGLDSSIDCLGDISHGSGYQSSRGGVVNTALTRYMSSLPRHDAGSYSGPAYSACIGTAPYGPSHLENISPNEPNYRASHYSLWYVLEGASQDCGEAVTVTHPDIPNDATLCRLMQE